MTVKPSPRPARFLNSYDLLDAHRHSDHHRAEILGSAVCGCFYCLETFPPTEIREWTDEPDAPQVTAICPHCGIDSVIGSQSGYPITLEFLQVMEQFWFSSVGENQN